MSKENEYRHFLRVSANDRVFQPIHSKPVGYFSISTKERTYEDSARNLQYFRQPKKSELPFDLNKGIKEAILKRLESEQLDHILRYILSHKSELLTANKQLCCDIVTFRGILRLIMCTPYDRNSWILRASHYKGTTYIHRLEDKDHGNAPCRWGFKFEQYCLVDKPSELPKTDEPVDECSEFDVVYRADLAHNLKLLYAAEMDGILSNTEVKINETADLERLQFVELKSVALSTERQKFFFNKLKTLNWWCQSHLVGTKNIYAGLNDGKGYTTHIEVFPVEELWRNKPWRRQVAINFLQDFLSKVQQVVSTADSAQTVFEFLFDGNGYIKYRKLGENSGAAFLKDWYIDGLNA